MSYPERLLTDDETVITEFHPHWRVLLLPISWTILAIAAVIVIWGVVDLDTTVAWLLTGLTFVLWIASSANAVLTRYFTQYILTTERIIVRTGILSKSGTEIPLENINNVLFTQQLFERMLGYGDLMVESAGETGQSHFENIPDPEGFQSAIYRAREARTLALEGGGAGGGPSGPRDPVEQLEALAQLHKDGALSDAEFEEKKRKLLDQI